jgi:hypothetical protein
MRSSSRPAHISQDPLSGFGYLLCRRLLLHPRRYEVVPHDDGGGGSGDRLTPAADAALKVLCQSVGLPPVLHLALPALMQILLSAPRTS